MKQKYKLMGLALSMTIISQSQAGFSIKKYSVNNGGAKALKGEGFELQSSIAQIDSSHELSSNSFKMNGGLWHENTDLIFKNNLEDNNNN